jgi:S-formylglutathione hydrolase FrmB
MSLFRGTVRSQLLKQETDLTVILPYDYPTAKQQEPCKVLYLLHGLGGSQECWTRYTNLERYARRYGVAVVSPTAIVRSTVTCSTAVRCLITLQRNSPNWLSRSSG